MKRWILRIVVFLLALLVLAAVAVQIVLRTDIPRRVVISVLQNESGLRVDADALRTGWGGHTAIENLTVALPLEADPFLIVPRMRISHTNLIKLLLTQRIDIIAAEVDQAFAEIKPNDRGEWNVLRALDSIARAQGPIDPHGMPIGVLPRVIVRNARFDIEGPDGSLVQYQPLTISAAPDDQLAWRFEVSVQRAGAQQLDPSQATESTDPQIAVTGRIAPYPMWTHTIAFDVDQIPLLIEPWLPDLPQPLGLSGTWQGQVHDAILSGQLRLSELIAGEADVHGDIDVLLRGRELVLTPTDLHFGMIGSPEKRIRLSGGTIRSDGRRLHIDRLMAEAFEAAARLTAVYDHDEERGRLSIGWQGRLSDLEVDHEGVFEASLHLPRIGRRSIVGSLTMNGDSPHGGWESAIDLDVSGHEWKTLRGRAVMMRLVWMDAKGEVDLSGLAARINNDWPRITVTHITIPDAHVRGGGWMNASTLDWHVDVDARDWALPGRVRDLWEEMTRIHASLIAEGRGLRIDTMDAKLALPSHELHVAGRYWPGEEPPLDATIEATSRLAADSQHDLTGRIEARLNLAGTIEPVNLTFDGMIRGRELRLLGRPMNPIDLPWHGTLDDRELRFAASEFDVAYGTWLADGRFDLDDRLLEFSLSGKDMSIARLLELADVPTELAGRAAADLSMTLPEFDFDRLAIDGTWSAQDLTGLTLLAAQGEGQLTMRGQSARLHDMTLVQDGGEITGEVRIHLSEKNIAHVDAAMRDWVTEVALAQNDVEGALAHRHEGLTTVTNGSCSLSVDLVELTANGEMEMTIDVALREAELGRMTFEGTVRGRDLHMAHFTADAFDGQLDGAGTIVLRTDRWPESTLNMDWSGVNLALLSRHIPALEQLRGISHGNLNMRRATEARPHEPILLELNIDIQDGAFDAMSLETIDARAFVGPRRAIVERVQVQAADGAIDFWGRLSRHENDLFAHGHVMMDGLDLDQLARASRLADEPTPGRVSGHFAAGGYPFSWGQHRLFGTGKLQLAESDLVAMPGIAELYGTLRLQLLGTPEPTGVGEAAIRLEGDALEIAPLTYFNRGVDVAARLRIENIWLREESPIFGIAGGVVRPLKDSDLPFVGRLDRLIGAVQTDAASVRITGTLAEREVEVVPLAEITGAFRRIFRGTAD